MSGCFLFIAYAAAVLLPSSVVLHRAHVSIIFSPPAPAPSLAGTDLLTKPAPPRRSGLKTVVKIDADHTKPSPLHQPPDLAISGETASTASPQVTRSALCCASISRSGPPAASHRRSTTTAAPTARSRSLTAQSPARFQPASGRLWPWDPGIGFIFPGAQSYPHRNVSTTATRLSFSRSLNSSAVTFALSNYHCHTPNPCFRCDTRKLWKFKRTILSDLIPEPLRVEQGDPRSFFLGLVSVSKDTVNNSIVLWIASSEKPIRHLIFIALFRAQCFFVVLCTDVSPTWMLVLASQV